MLSLSADIVSFECVYYSSNIFRNTQLGSITEYHRQYSSVLSHSMRLDQSRASENILWILYNLQYPQKW